MVNSYDFAHAESLLSRILAGEQNLRNEFASSLLSPLAEWLMHVNRSVSPDLCHTAAEDIILRLIDRPDRFNSIIQKFEFYLKKIAQRRLFDIIRSEKSHQRPAIHGKNKTWNRVELDSLETYYLWGVEDDPSIAYERQEHLQLLNDIIERFKSRISLTESRILDLLLNETRSSMPYAEVLQIQHDTVEERSMMVKRAKDRVLKKFKRYLKSNQVHELLSLIFRLK